MAKGKQGKQRKFTFTPIDGPPPPPPKGTDTFRERYGEEALWALCSARARGRTWPLGARFERVVCGSDDEQEREGSQGEKDGQDPGNGGRG